MNEENKRKQRSDSVYGKLTPDQIDRILSLAESMPPERVHAEFGCSGEKLGVSVSTLKRIIKRARLERSVIELEESEEASRKLSELARDPSTREAALGLMQKRLLDAAAAPLQVEELLKLSEVLHAQKAREEEQEIARRRVAVAEENARTGRRKLEFKGTMAAIELLAKLKTILLDSRMEPREKVIVATECITKETPELMPHREMPAIEVRSEKPGKDGK